LHRKIQAMTEGITLLQQHQVTMVKDLPAAVLDAFAQTWEATLNVRHQRGTSDAA
jgi:hypothetical protein